MDTKTLYQFHKWLAAVAAAAALGWFASGALMVVPPRFLTLSPGISTAPDAEGRLPGAPAFDEATVAPSVAIAAVNHAIGRAVRVTGIKLRRLPDGPAYEIGTERNGSRLVDARDGSLIIVTEELAKQIVMRLLGGNVAFEAVTRQTEPRLGYAAPLPAYRVSVADGKGTVVYVDMATAQIRTSDYLSRSAGLIMGLHGMWFLRLFLPGGAVQILMFALAVTGTVVTASGILILLVQLRRWWQRPQSRVDGAGRPGVSGTVSTN